MNVSLHNPLPVIPMTIVRLYKLSNAAADNGQFQVTVFSRFCYVLLCNHDYFHCLNHRQAKDYITVRNETERKL